MVGAEVVLPIAASIIKAVFVISGRSREASILDAIRGVVEPSLAARPKRSELERRIAEALASQVSKTVRVERTRENSAEIERIVETVARRIESATDTDEAIMAAFHEPGSFADYLRDHGARREEEDQGGEWQSALYHALLDAAVAAYTPLVHSVAGFSDVLARDTNRTARQAVGILRPPTPTGPILKVPEATGAEVPRPDLFNPLRAQLKAAARGDTSVVGVVGGVGLHGAGGFGKTTIARMLANDSDVRVSYPGGVVWVQFSETETEQTHIAAKLNEVTRWFSGVDPSAGTPATARESLIAALPDRRPVLLVIDDVWRSDQLTAFQGLGEHVVLLVTTRNSGLLPTGTAPTEVDTMSAGQARALLLQGLTFIDGEERTSAPIVDGILRATGRWPLLLGLVNGAVREASSGRPSGEALSECLDRLREGGVTDLDPTNPERREQAVHNTMSVSLERLTVSGRDCRDLYESLAVFPSDHQIPVEALHRWWQPRTRWSAARTRDFCASLRRLSLINEAHLEPSSPKTQWIRLHDVIADYLARQHTPEEKQHLHASLVGAHRSLVPVTASAEPGSGLPTAWWELPDDSDYWREWLGYHLNLAEPAEEAELVALLRHPRYLAVSLERDGRDLLDLDLSAVVERTPGLMDLVELRRVLRQDAPVLSPMGDSCWLAQTLASRLPPEGCTRDLGSQLIETVPRHRLLPNGRVPDLPHEALSHTLTGHTGLVSALAIAPDSHWLATASDDATVRIWDPDTGHCRHTLTGHTGWVSALAIAPDGHWLATASIDATVRIWDPDTGRCLSALRTASSLSALAVTDDLVAAAGGHHLFLFRYTR